MKKKIKDITFFDVNELCYKYDCVNCPLCLATDMFAHKRCIIWLLDHSMIDEWKDYIEREVEI